MGPAVQNQNRDVFMQEAIAQGLRGALSALGLGDLVAAQTVKVSVYLAPPEDNLEVAILYPKDKRVSVAGKSVAVADVINLAMSYGDQERLQAIRRLTPSYGQAEGETVATNRAWLPMRGTPNNSSDCVVYFRRNPEFPLLTGY